MLLLETRMLLTTIVPCPGEGVNTLKILGDDSDEVIEVFPTGDSLVVKVNGVAQSFLNIDSVLVYGEDGNDVIKLRGNLSYFADGGDGDDLLVGSVGNDWLQDGYGKDTIIGGEGNDYIVGGFDEDSLLGGPGNDVLLGEHGADTLLGGSGTDTAMTDTSFVDSLSSVESVL